MTDIYTKTNMPSLAVTARMHRNLAFHIAHTHVINLFTPSLVFETASLLGEKFISQ